MFRDAVHGSNPPNPHASAAAARPFPAPLHTGTRPRRRHSYFADRRPRFLVRRSTGSLGMSMKIEGKEIIARS